MRTLAITQNMTLDGSVEMLDSWFDPLQQDDDLLAESHRQDADCDAVLLGRDTFESFRSFWPAQDDDATGITDYLNNVQKYVVSSTLTEPGWQNSTIIGGDPIAAVRDLKEQDGADIVCTGSISLSHTLLEAGLVDELRLFVYPAVQGRGRRLVPDGFARSRLQLWETKAFPSGVAYLCYVLGH